MLIIANSYRRLNLWNANCGASFKAHMFARTCVRWRRKLHEFELPGALALGHSADRLDQRSAGCRGLGIAALMAA
jgi:hypothetical protein